MIKIQAEPLVLRASREGVVVPPANLPRKASGNKALERWSGLPMDQTNVGAFLDRDTLFCMIAEEGKFEAIIVVDQSDVSLLAPEQPAKILLEQYRNQVLNCTVSFVAQDELSNVARELSQTNGGPIAVKPSPEGTEQAVLKLFEVHTAIAPEHAAEKNVKLMSGYYGIAKIRVGEASLGYMTLRYFRNLINFR